MKTTLDILSENNEFPIIFIGSGLSKRFLIDFPDWTGLLEEFWEEIGLTNFYGEFNKLIDKVKNENPNFTDKELEHHSNILMGSLIEEKYNEAFNNEIVHIEGFNVRDAFITKVSPFKKAISVRFSDYNIKNEMKSEIVEFKKMLLKTQVILTTNYDSFIEDAYKQDSNYELVKYIGQKGFFQDTFGYAELFKLHGSVDSPNDIVISREDYEKFEANSILISAKVISMMMYSPIIFIGYSLTDINIRNIIKQFTNSLTEKELEIIENRLIVIERKEGEQEFQEELINDKDFGCKIRVIKTDNYKEVFKFISKINQGIAPAEVRKYQHVIKQLIVDKGREGALRTVLLSPIELEQVEKMIKEQGKIPDKLVVALGDSKIIFQIPNKITYLEDYIFEKNELSLDVTLRFLANEAPNGRYPFLKHVTMEKINSSNLQDYEKEKLRQRLNLHGDLDKQIKTIPTIYHNYYKTLEEIIHNKFVWDRELSLIAYNIGHFDLNEIEGYIKKNLRLIIESGENKINTHFRRLMLIFDHYKCKK